MFTCKEKCSFVNSTIKPVRILAVGLLQKCYFIQIIIKCCIHTDIWILGIWTSNAKYSDNQFSAFGRQWIMMNIMKIHFKYRILHSINFPLCFWCETVGHKVDRSGC